MDPEPRHTSVHASAVTLAVFVIAGVVAWLLLGAPR